MAALPERVAHAAFARGADALWAASLVPGLRGASALAGVRQLQRNLDRARPDIAARPGARRALRRAALRSYARYWCDAFRLDRWDAERRRGAFSVLDLEPVAAEAAAGRGMVMALAHSASWDVAGAWASQELAPVTTVAERLEPPEVFAAFVAARARVGIEALPLTGGSPPLPTLVRRVRAGGFVPLLVDRDLGGAGVEVDLLGGRVRMGGGAAALADVTGAVLFALESWYEPDPTSPTGWLVVARPHRIPPATGATRAERVQALTQACADVLGAGIARHPQDWHMLQPVFLDDPALADRARSRAEARRS